MWPATKETNEKLARTEDRKRKWYRLFILQCDEGAAIIFRSTWALGLLSPARGSNVEPTLCDMIVSIRPSGNVAGGD